MMKKVFALSFVAALSIFGTALANCLWIDEKSKDYTADAAINEINNSITTQAMVETSDYLLSARPVLVNRTASGDLTIFGPGFVPYSKPESYLKHNATGYIIRTRGKSFMSKQYIYGAILLEAKNKTNAPLVIDVNQSALRIGAFYGQPFYQGRFRDQGNNAQPNFIVPPKQSKSVLLYRSDAQFESSRLGGTGWIYPVTPLNFNNIEVEASLKVGDKYITLTGNGKIPQEIQDKFDMGTQWNKKKVKKD